MAAGSLHSRGWLGLRDGQAVDPDGEALQVRSHQRVEGPGSLLWDVGNWVRKVGQEGWSAALGWTHTPGVGRPGRTMLDTFGGLTSVGNTRKVSWLSWPHASDQQCPASDPRLLGPADLGLMLFLLVGRAAQVRSVDVVPELCVSLSLLRLSVTTQWGWNSTLSCTPRWGPSPSPWLRPLLLGSDLHACGSVGSSLHLGGFCGVFMTNLHVFASPCPPLHKLICWKPIPIHTWVSGPHEWGQQMGSSFSISPWLNLPKAGAELGSDSASRWGAAADLVSHEHGVGEQAEGRTPLRNKARPRLPVADFTAVLRPHKLGLFRRALVNRLGWSSVNSFFRTGLVLTPVLMCGCRWGEKQY